MACGVACGGVEAKPVAQPPPAAPAAFTPGARLLRFHSTRFSVSLPLPDGPRWRIDDHKTAMLRATHEASYSKVELVVWREEELMNRQKCEDRAREKGYGERAGDEVDSETASVPAGWDTFVWIGADRGTADQTHRGEVTANLYAFAANVRKCLYFHFSTNAAASETSDRLAFVRLRVLGDLRLDSFDVPREHP
jgi:hypothetical protein